MKTISNLVNEVGGIIDNLSLSTHEKKQIRSSVIDTLYRYASELEKEQGIRNPDGSSGELAAKILASPGNALLYVYHSAGGIYSDPFIR